MVAALLGIATSAGAQTFLTFSGPAGEYISQGQSYSYTSQNASFSAIPQLNGAILFQVNSPPNGFTHFWFLALQPYPGNRLNPGVYLNAARWPFQVNQPGLSLFGDGRGCNTSIGTFTVLSSSYDTAGTLVSLHATFEQHCEGFPAAVTGEISYAPAAIPATSPTLALLMACLLAAVGLFVLAKR